MSSLQGVVTFFLYSFTYAVLGYVCVVRETIKDRDVTVIQSLRQNKWTYSLFLLRILNLGSNLGVLVVWASVALATPQIPSAAGTDTLNMLAVFGCSILMFMYHRFMTGYGMYKITSSSDRGWLQLCDCNTFSAMYFAILNWQTSTNSTTTFRWILRMGAVLESFPFAVLQLIFLVKVGGHPVDGLVQFSLFLNCLSLVFVFIVDDTDNVLPHAQIWYIGPEWKSWRNMRQNFSLSIRIIFRIMDALSRTWILAFIWIAAGGGVFLLVLIVEFAVAFSMAVCPLVCTESFDFISIMTVMPFDRSVRYSPFCTCYGMCSPAANYSERVFAIRYSITFLELVVGFGLQAELVYYTPTFYDHFVFCWVAFTLAVLTFVLWMRDLISPSTIEIRNVFSYTRDNQPQALRQLLEFGGIVHIVDDLGQTPLHYGAQNNTLETLDVLLEMGVPVNAQDLRGYTALMVAVEKNHFEVGQKLIESGADPTIQEYQQHFHAYGLIRLRQSENKKKWRKILEKNLHGTKYRDIYPKIKEEEDEFWDDEGDFDDELSDMSSSHESYGRRSSRGSHGRSSRIVTVGGREDSRSHNSRSGRRRVSQELSVGTNSKSSRR